MDLKGVMRDLTRVTERVVIKVTLDVHANLVAPPPAGTPRDTGWAVGNFVPSIGAPTRTPIGVPGTAVSPNLGVIAGYTLPRGSVFISNNVPYIVPLNLGRSRQTPAGYIERGIEKAVTKDLRAVLS